MKKLYIEKGINNKRIAYLEGDELIEVYIDELKEKSKIGNIYRARVVDIIEGMNAAFIDIGEGKNAFLSLKDALPKDKIKDGKEYSIKEILKSGSEIIVQVVRDAIGDKGPKVTSHIELSGRYIVFTPYNERINISRKINKSVNRKRLKILGEDIRLNEGGMIIRTISEKQEDYVIKNEYEKLYKIYERIDKERSFLPCPKLLYRNLDDWEEIIRDRELDKIIINDKDIYSDILNMEDQYERELQELIVLDKDFSMDYDLNIAKQVNRALSRDIHLKSGASIVIDELEALTAIDINTKGYIGKKDLETTIENTNLEAGLEIAKQIRLRNLAGIIIIDFIKMRDENAIDLIISKMEEIFAKDPIQTNIVGMTRLGLLEITRKRERPSLSESLYVECKAGKGKGKLRKTIDI